MATTSFNKSFVVTDSKSIEQFKKDAQSPRKIVVEKRDYQEDKQKGIAILKRRLSSLEIS